MGVIVGRLGFLFGGIWFGGCFGLLVVDLLLGFLFDNRLFGFLFFDWLFVVVISCGEIEEILSLGGVKVIYNRVFLGVWYCVGNFVFCGGYVLRGFYVFFVDCIFVGLLVCYWIALFFSLILYICLEVSYYF